MARRAVLAKIEIERIVLGLETQLVHAREQLVIVVLTLAAADDLADAGNEAVHRRDGLAVGVQLHIEGLDLLRVVGDEHRALEDLLGKIPLVLGLQIAAPIDLVVKAVVVLFEKLDGFGIRHAAKIGGHDVVQTLQQALVDKLVEKRHLLGRVFQNIRDDELDHILGQGHVVGEVSERDLRLDHPELGRVACGVGVFGAERGAEGVDIAEGHGVGLAVELAGDGQVRGLGEKVPGVVNLAVGCARRVVDIQRCDLEHFARALAVGARDERRVDVDKVALLEELVDGVGGKAAHAEHGLEHVGARTQMRHRAQILHRVPLGLDGEIGCGRALNEDFTCLNLKRLLGLRRFDKRARDDQGRADVEFGDFSKIGEFCAVDDLYLREKRAVGEVDEAEILRRAQVANPAAELDFLAGIRSGISK